MSENEREELSERPPRGRMHPPLATARLTLGASGTSIATYEHLRFQLDHALARDAVHAQLDTNALLQGLAAMHLSAIRLRSAAPDRATYLRRPDLGRRLAPESHDLLAVNTPTTPPEVAIILADGLSAQAIERHALPLLTELLAFLDPRPLTLGPVTIATNARVALGDEIGHLLHAKLTLLLIGERPGLSSPDSLGVYITWQPQPGRTDANRNCISNIRHAGLSYAEAAHRIAHYLREANRLQTTGTALKDPEKKSAPRFFEVQT